MHAYARDALAARPLAPWSKTVESAALLLNRCTQLPLDDCEGLAGTILGMAAASHVQPAPIATVMGLAVYDTPAPAPRR
jgi:hypothetical protein